MKHLSLCSLISITIGVSFLIFSGVLILFRYDIYEQCKYLLLHISPNSEMFKKWIRNPFPMQLDFYLFNWTNSDDINYSTIKPNFIELGPYSFNETNEKVNLSWNDNNNTLSFNVKRTWYFNENQFRTLDEDIIVPNTINLAAVENTRYDSYFTKKSLSVLLSTASSGITINRTIRQILFEGYSDFILSIGNVIATHNAPKLPKFSFFYGRNASESYEGHFNMNLDYNHNGQLLEWNYNKTSKRMPNKCNGINAPIHDLFNHDLKKDKPFQFFFPDICRPLMFDYDGEVKIKDLKGLKFVVRDRMLDNGTNIKGNECYCDGKCYPSGIINVTSCRGAPAFISLPHFYNADPCYTTSIDGVKPDKEKHEFYIILEPNTGVVLDLSARLQMNVLLNPDTDIVLYSNVPKLVLPILWFEQKFTLPDDLVFKIGLLIELPKILLLIGFVLILIGILIIFFTTRKILKNKRYINEKYKWKLKEFELKQNLKSKTNIIK